MVKILKSAEIVLFVIANIIIFYWVDFLLGGFRQTSVSLLEICVVPKVFEKIKNGCLG